MLVLLLLVSSVTAYLDDVVDYTNYTVVSTVAKTKKQLSLLQQLYLEDVSYQVDFWNEPRNLGEPISLGLPKLQVEKLSQLLRSVGASLSLADTDLKELIEKELDSNPPQLGRGETSLSFALNQFHRFPEIETYLRQLEMENPKMVRRSIVGHTEQNREIIALKISTDVSNSSNKPIVLIDAGIHAREWAAPATALYIISQLIRKYKTDELITRLVDTYDWYVIPVMNPDGYVYTWSLNRHWRKNRSRPAPFSGCYGVDPNRNFALGFAGAATSKNPCSDLYPGPSAFSEAEARALKSITEQNAKRIRIAITLHAFGQMWMNPWGYMNKRPSDYNAMMLASKKAVEALKSAYGKTYKIGSIFEVIYPAGGGSIDWQYSVLNTPYTYAVELRPIQGDLNAFQLPREEILPVGEETWKAISTLANNLI